MHNLTKAKAKNVLVHRANLGQGKRRIWVGALPKSNNISRDVSEALTIPKAIRDAHPMAPNHVAPSPILESQRAVAVGKLRKQLVDECERERAPPALAIERWLLNALLERDLSNKQTSRDPLLRANLQAG